MEQFSFWKVAFGERKKDSSKKVGIILVKQGQELDPGNPALHCGENKGLLPPVPDDSHTEHTTLFPVVATGHQTAAFHGVMESSRARKRQQTAGDRAAFSFTPELQLFVPDPTSPTHPVQRWAVGCSQQWSWLFLPGWCLQDGWGNATGSSCLLRFNLEKRWHILYHSGLWFNQQVMLRFLYSG